EEFQAQLQAADMRLDLAGQRLRGIELGNVNGEIDGIGHDFSGPIWSVSSIGGWAGGISVPAGGVSSTAGGTVAGASAAVAVRAAFSSALIRRLSRQVTPRWYSHIGTRPSRKDTTTSAGTFVSRIRS